MAQVLTVRKLLKELSALDPDAPVVLTIQQEHYKVLDYLIEDSVIQVNVKNNMWLGRMYKSVLQLKVGELAQYTTGGYDVLVQRGEIQPSDQTEGGEATDVCARMADEALARWQATQRLHTTYRLG